MTATGVVAFDHLDHLSDKRGLFEHADGTERRLAHGYCTDDNARLLVVTSRESDHGAAHRLARLALDFVLDGLAVDGRVRNRLDHTGRWTDVPSAEDCWGRAVWGLGTAAARHPDAMVRDRARFGFERAAQVRSPWPRAMAFAAIGAAEVLAVDPLHAAARALLADAAVVIGRPVPGAWVWPEPRLTYANAALAEALVAAGAALGHAGHLADGLAMLRWLLDLETASGHLSVTPVGGRGPGEAGPHFDQQPIEVAALADACARAAAVTGDRSWAVGVTAAVRWFEGANDAGVVMFDPVSGGGFDGLSATGVNLNQGAESTLAYVSVMQQARTLVATP